ncbi:jg7907, partial [Pararge aegeria aegeria]
MTQNVYGIILFQVLIPLLMLELTRAAAEEVACRLLRRLEAAPAWGEALLSPGPWHNHHQNNESDKEVEPWSSDCECRLRAHAARLKRDTVALRELRPPPSFYSPH